MKTIIILAGLAAASNGALAAIPIGRGELSATLGATATYDSNVFGTPDATGDFSATLTPRVLYLRKAGLIEAEAGAGIAFIRYRDQTQLDATNKDANATLRITAADLRNYTGSLAAAYRETSDVNTDLNARVNMKTITVAALSSFATGPRSNLALSGNYSDARSTGAGDQQILTTLAQYNYQDFFYGNSLRLTGGYDQTSSSGANARGVPLDQNSYLATAGLYRSFANNALHAGISYGYRVLNRSAAETGTGVTRQAGSVITASIDGPFLPAKYFPKVKSEFALSYQDAATPGINDTGTKELTGRLSLAWQARENTSVVFSAQRVQRLTVNDLSVVSTSVQLGLEQKLRYNLTGSLSAGYDWSTFRTVNRNDRTASAGAGLKYHFARTWDANLTYVYRSTTSTVPQSTFDRQLTSLSVTHQF